jgi:hypothetical protein
MDTQVANVANNSPPKTNRGWFRGADRRINREGRPRGSKRVPDKVVDRAPCADRLCVLFVPLQRLRRRIRNQNGFWIPNLPGDFEIVSVRVDTAQQRVAFVIRSRAFPRIAKGAEIPEFAGSWCGLMWQ